MGAIRLPNRDLRPNRSRKGAASMKERALRVLGGLVSTLSRKLYEDPDLVASLPIEDVEQDIDDLDSQRDSEG